MHRRRRYDRVTRSLHGLVAVQILAQFSLALAWKAAGHGLHAQMVRLHVSLGLCLAVTLMLRMLWRALYAPRLPAISASRWTILARLVHGLLYVIMTAEVATGILKRWALGLPVSAFGLIGIPPPFQAGASLFTAVSTVHSLLAWALIGLALCHVLAALFHRVILRDDVLASMIGR